jgi:hypothetical protein
MINKNICTKIHFKEVIFFISFIVLLVSIVYANGTSPPVNSPKQMFGFYKFNNDYTVGENYTSGLGPNNVFDYSNFLKNITSKNNITYNSTEGYLNDGAFIFDGIDDNLDLGSRILNENETLYYSISVWIKKNDAYTGTRRGIVSQWASSSDNGGFFIQNYFQLVGFQVAAANQSTYNVYKDISASYNSWHHLVGVRNNDTIYFYVDGALAGSKGGINKGYNGNSLRVGSRGSLYIFNGTIDDVIIYNSSLSYQEVLNLYYSYLDCNPSTGNIDCSKNCTLNENYKISNNLTFRGTGLTILNGNFTFNGTNQYIFQNSGCELRVNSGGGIK